MVARIGRIVATLGVVVSLMACTLSSAAGASVIRPVLHIGVDDEFTGCNPGSQITSTSTQMLLSLVQPETTVVQSGDVLSPANSVITQAEVVGLKPMKVVYTIAPGAVWSDGTPVGLSDFLATWHAGADGDAPASVQYQLISSIVPVSGQANSIEVLFSSPASGWRDLFNPLMPASTIGAANDCRIPSPDVNLSSGPYLIASSTVSGATLVANPQWTGTPPQYSAIIFTLGSSEVSRSLAQAGSESILITSNSRETFANGLSSLPTVRSSSLFSNDLISLDFSVKASLTSRRQMRVALAGLVRRQILVNAVGGAFITGLQPAMSHFWTQGMINFSGTASALPQPEGVNAPGSPNQYYEPKLAGHNLKLLGYAKRDGKWISHRGHHLVVTVATPRGDSWLGAVTRHLTIQWNEHGIGVRVIHVAGVIQAERLVRRGFVDLAVVGRATSPYLSETARWYLPVGPKTESPLWNGFHDLVSAGTLAAASSDLNPDDATSLYQQIDNRLWITMSSLPMMVEPQFLVTSASLLGVEGDPYEPGLFSMMGQWRTVTTPTGN